MAVVRFEENGQGFFDFEYLLSITNEQFVEKIKSYVPKSLDTVVRINESKVNVNVYLHSIAGFSHFNFIKEDQSIYVTHLTHSDIKIMNEMLGDFK